MHNQVPAPVGQGHPSSSASGDEGASQTYPIGDPNEYQQFDISPSASSTGNAAILALLDTARQARQEGRLDVAASTLERAVRIEPRNPVVWHELAWVRFQQKQVRLAVSLAEKSNLLAEQNTRIRVSNWLLISECEEALGNPVGAERAREQASNLQ